MNVRAKALNEKRPRADAAYVLYWAQMNRRVESNHALLYAAELANQLGLPVLYYEGLTCSYPHASDRLHTFILEGVPDQQRRLQRAGIGYVFCLRRRRSDPDDALYRLADDAAVVVTDDYPTFIARRHNESVPAKLDIPYLVVDSSCIVPMRLLEKREWAAYTIRPKIKRMLPEYLKPADALDVKQKFSGDIPDFHTEVTHHQHCAACFRVRDRPSCRTLEVLYRRTVGSRKALEALPGKQSAALCAAIAMSPRAHATSDMSPYLHFGQISSLEIALAAKCYAEEHELIADEYLEELIVRRELAFNFALFSEKPDSLQNLPDWAKQTLLEHAADKRSPSYTREQFETARTHDVLWNATQKELLLRGKTHGYYRMYWGKKIIEWSPTAQDALETMVYLQDRYAHRWA